MADTPNTGGKHDEPNDKPYPKGHWVHVVTMILVAIYTGFQAYQTFLIRSNNVISEQAFLFPEFVLHAALSTDNSGNPVAINVDVTTINSGNTPAIAATTTVGCIPSFQDLDEPWILMRPGLDKMIGKATPLLLGPHTSHDIDCGFSISDFEQIAAGKTFGYVLIKINYRDKLDPRVLHTSEGAWKIRQAIYSPPISVPSPNGAPEKRIPPHFGVSFIGKGAHNCADEDCPSD